MFASNRNIPGGRRRRGFTLVELLMVIVIIGLLMALVMPAIWAAQLNARRARVNAEIAQLDMKMQEYNSVVGAFPPSVLTNNAGSYGASYGDAVVARHFRKQFPRYGYANSHGTIQNDIVNKWTARAPHNINVMTPAEALVFWLGGYVDGNMNPTGFNKNPLDPMNVSAATQRTTALYDFDTTRLRDRNGNGFPEYYPPDTNFRAPYVYFAALPNGEYTGSFSIPSSITPGATGVARPYRTNAGGWLNPKGFQIIWSGFDFDYGDEVADPNDANTYKQFPGGARYSPGDMDNQTNFATGILEDNLP